MTYLPTDADLALLNNHSSNIYCRIEMLNKDFITIDSLEGLVIDGSISIDSESDVRRTFNVTLYLGKKSGISSLTEEDWISKNVRVFIGLSGRGMSKISGSKSIDEMIKANADYYLLKNTTSTMVIVECGFLSNLQEAKQLQEAEYQKKVAQAIGMGVLYYLGESGETKQRKEDSNGDENTAGQSGAVWR